MTERNGPLRTFGLQGLRNGGKIRRGQLLSYVHHDSQVQPCTMPRKAQQTIVIAEDDRSLRILLKYVLEDEGFFCEVCADGREAIHMLSEFRDAGTLPAMILLDLNMPHVDGWQVASWLHNDPVLDDIPVIVISATEEHGLAAKRMNVDAYLVKPFATDEIIGIVSLFALLSR